MKNEYFAEYDFIVVGDHPAALWGAVTLLERGHKVLVLPMGTASKNFFPRSMLETLRIDPALIPNRDLDPVQILTNQKRFRLFSTLEALKEEYFFVYGKPLEDLHSLDADFVRGLAFLDRGSETGPVFPDEWKTMINRVNDLIYFPFEPGWIQRQFHHRIRELNGHVATELQLQRVFVERGTFVGVQISGSSSIIRAQQVLIGSNWNRVQNLFSEQTALKSQPVSWAFEMELKIGAESIPQGLGSYMIFSQPNAPLVEFQHDHQGGLTLRTTLPFHEKTLDRVEERKIAQRLFKTASLFIPDLEYNLEKISPDIRDPEKAEKKDLPELYPFRTLKDIPAALLRYAIPGLGYTTPIQGVSIAYEEAFPKMGEWGAYQAVSSAIQDWIKRTQKPVQKA